MNISLRRLRALIKKEFKDFPKNMNVSLMCLLPIVLVLLLSRMQGSDVNQQLSGIELLLQGLNVNLVMVSTFAMSMLIAEEKEKNTLRVLMLSSVSPAEFLMGKAIVILLFSVITNTIIYALAGFGLVGYISFLIWSVLVTVVMITIGGIIGLIAKNQMSTSVIGMPVIFAFMIIPLLSRANALISRIAGILPNYNLSIILSNISDGLGYAQSLNNMMIILGWIVLTMIAFAYTYNKKRLDS